MYAIFYNGRRANSLKFSTRHLARTWLRRNKINREFGESYAVYGYSIFKVN